MISSRSQLSHPKYRPDIDGLRAIAVLSAVIFHAFPNWVKGGFIGVDIFFVISGYLISIIIFENLDKGTFSFREFYSRRIRRIFPALFLVLTVIYALGWFTFLADEYKQLGQHIAGGSTFISNFILLKESGYFDNTSETKPLLHLWSLGIEEQFYLIYPLLLWLAWKRDFDLLNVVISISIISFFLNLKGIENDIVLTFYSPQTRFWELMSGSILAWSTLYEKNFLSKNKTILAKSLATILYKKPRGFDGKTLKNVISFIGCLLLGYGFFCFSKDLVFPGKWALIPVLGSVLIISAGKQAWINQNILSSRIAVWFGLISFPLYLWHWPLLSFSYIIQGEPPNQAVRITIVALSILLAWLSYKFVERPIRLGRYRNIKTVILLLSSVIIGLVGYITYLKDGLTFREDAYLQNRRDGDIGHLDYHKYIADKYFLCTPKEIANEALTWEGYTRCMQSKPGNNIDIALIGDSHAEHLFIGMSEVLSDKNIVFYIKASPPFLDNSDYHKIYETVIKSKTIKIVILSMHWAGKLTHVPKESTLDAELMKIVDAISVTGKNVCLTEDVPIFPFDSKKCKGSRRFGLDNTCKIPYSSVKSQTDIYLSYLMKVANNRPPVKVLPVGKYLCDIESCSMVKNNSVLYRDTNHLNINGSSFVGRHLVKDNLDLFR